MSDNESKSEVDQALDDVLDEMPDDEKQFMKRSFGLFMQMGSTVSPQARLMNKLTSENISEFAQIESKDLELAYKESVNSKVFYGFVLILVTIIFFGTILLLKDQPDLLKEFLIPIITAILGAAGGYGVGYGRGKKNEK